MTHENKLYILGCSVAGVLVSFMPAVSLPIVGSMSLSASWQGKLMLLGFILIGGGSFFFYEEVVKRFTEKYVRYALLGTSIAILLYLFYFLDKISSVGSGMEDNPFGQLFAYSVQPKIGIYLEIIVAILLIVFVRFFEKYLPLQTKLIQKIKAK